MPGAARKGDIGDGHSGFPPTSALSGSPDVEINGQPALRVGDPFEPHKKPKNPMHPRALSVGSGTVLINGKPAGRIGDAIDCGGAVITGSGDVEIG